MPETIKMYDVPDDTKEYLTDYKDKRGLTWRGFAIHIEDVLKAREQDA